jgi:hypothetical protein
MDEENQEQEQEEGYFGNNESFIKKKTKICTVQTCTVQPKTGYQTPPMPPLLIPLFLFLFLILFIHGFVQAYEDGFVQAYEDKDGLSMVSLHPWFRLYSFSETRRRRWLGTSG